mgnify:CR=1 FL=1
MIAICENGAVLSGPSPSLVGRIVSAIVVFPGDDLKFVAEVMRHRGVGNLQIAERLEAGIVNVVDAGQAERAELLYDLAAEAVGFAVEIVRRHIADGTKFDWLGVESELPDEIRIVWQSLPVEAKLIAYFHAAKEYSNGLQRWSD